MKPTKPLNERKLLTIEGWRALNEVQRAEAAPDSILIKESGKAIVDGEKPIQFILSTSAVDRMSDTIDQKGWKLDIYETNPIVLWQHDRWIPGIGHSKVWLDGDKLMGQPNFPSKESEMAALVERLIRHGTIRTCSVGFQPIKWKSGASDERGDYATDFLEQELMEWSPCNIPANHEALVSAKSAGIDIRPLVRWAEQTMERSAGEGVWVPKSMLSKEALEKIALVAAGSPVSVTAPAKVDPAPVVAAAPEIVPPVVEVPVVAATVPVVVKGASEPFEKYPVVGGKWDAARAIKHAKEFSRIDKEKPATKDNINWKTFGKFFCGHKGDGKDFGEYFLPHHDVRGDAIVTVKAGVEHAAGRLDQVEGISAAERMAAKRHLAKEYHSWGGKAPWEKEMSHAVHPEKKKLLETGDKCHVDGVGMGTIMDSMHGHHVHVEFDHLPGTPHWHPEKSVMCEDIEDAMEPSEDPEEPMYEAGDRCKVDGIGVGECKSTAHGHFHKMEFDHLPGAYFWHPQIACHKIEQTEPANPELPPPTDDGRAFAADLRKHLGLPPVAAATAPATA